MMPDIRKIAAVAVTFISNFIVVKLFWTFALFTPIEGCGTVSYLKSLLLYLHIAPVADNVAIVLSVVSLLVPCLVYRTDLVQHVTLWLMGARRAQGEDRQRIEDAFSQVCERNGSSLGDYNLYVAETEEENAWAFGANHVAVTRPLLNVLSQEELAGVLAHEAGHLAHGDTGMLTLTACMQNVGHLADTILCGVTNVCVWVAKIPIVGLAAAVLSWFITLTLILLRLLVNLPSNLIILYLSRQDEYAADDYACELGLGRELYNGLSRFCCGDQKMSFWQRIQSTHPDIANRLARIHDFVERQYRKAA